MEEILFCFVLFSFFSAELNRCHLDLTELNRLIQRLQVVEVGQAFSNGDLQRIISIQVDGPVGTVRLGPNLLLLSRQLCIKQRKNNYW